MIVPGLISPDPPPAPAQSPDGNRKHPFVSWIPFANDDVPSPLIARFPAVWILCPALIKPVCIPSKVEVAEFTVSCPWIVEEEVMVRVPVRVESPVMPAPPAFTLSRAPEVILPLAVMLLELVRKPADTPCRVEVPDTVRFLEITALSVIYIERSANNPPLKVEVAVVDVA